MDSVPCVVSTTQVCTSIMEQVVRLRGIFKLIVALYFSVLVVILVKLHGNAINDMLHGNEKSVTKRNMTEMVRNVTKYIYINNTVVIFKDPIQKKYGPGENGTGVALHKTSLSKDTLKDIEMKRNYHGFNTYVSDIISLHRTLPDMRSKACKEKVYPPDLPPASVVVIFRDEWHSIVLRTGYSVLEHSPPELIKEVIFVDDGSENGDLKTIIATHVRTVSKFKLVTNKEPMGLMMARQKGIEAVTSDYFIVMDGHMEAGPGWLEPLIYTLVQEPKACLCSHVGAIMQDDLKYRVDDPESTYFDSQFPFFDPLTLDQQWAWFKKSYRNARNHSFDPLEYGTIQGMMAAMRKDFFLQLGGFDPGMKVWGTEQMELSFKVWMCGGRVLMIPCSKVAHMYRYHCILSVENQKRLPSVTNAADKTLLALNGRYPFLMIFRNTPWGKVNVSSDHGSANKQRTMDVWMDEPYRGLVQDYLRNRKYDTGSLEDRHRIRRENHCLPYQFYVDKVKELTDIFFPTSVKAHRTVKNTRINRCFDMAQVPNTTDEHNLILYPCHGNGNQNFVWTEELQIRSCGGRILMTELKNRTHVLKVTKHPENIYDGESYWDYRPDKTIFHTASGLCITANATQHLELKNCTGQWNQVWTWEVVT